MNLALLADPRQLAYRLWLRWHRLDYGGAGVATDTAHEHAMSGGPNLDAVLRILHVPPGATCIDYGSGKGIAMLTLRRHFAEVVGVELSEALLEAAKANLRRLGLSAPRWTPQNRPLIDTAKPAIN